MTLIATTIEYINGFYEVMGINDDGAVKHIGEWYKLARAVRNDDRLTQEYTRKSSAIDRAQEIARAQGVAFLPADDTRDERIKRIAARHARMEAQKQRYPVSSGEFERYIMQQQALARTGREW
jgi:hypothetical protein